MGEREKREDREREQREDRDREKRDKREPSQHLKRNIDTCLCLLFSSRHCVSPEFPTRFGSKVLQQ